LKPALNVTYNGLKEGKKGGQKVGDRIRKKKMATVYEIIQGINQAAANAYDGSHDESVSGDGQARSAGLTREEGDFINDRRVMDGFKVSFHGPLLRVKYQAEVLIKNVQKNDFEDTIISHLKDIVKFLKKEYKAITGNTISLTLQGEHHIRVDRISNYRTDCQAHCDYRIGGMTDNNVALPGTGGDVEEANRRLDTAVVDWLKLGPKNKRPKNDTRKKGK
tara:strand:+ start:124 stop:783 length:660 start_codon:yes stop_codon:yes gene_type:complete